MAMPAQTITHIFHRYRTLQTHRDQRIAYCDTDATQRL
jgi:hypothetical protein